MKSVRQFIQKVVDEFGGDAPPAYYMFGEDAVGDGQLMQMMEQIMSDCGLSFTKYIIEGKNDAR